MDHLTPPVQGREPPQDLCCFSSPKLLYCAKWQQLPGSPKLAQPWLEAHSAASAGCEGNGATVPPNVTSWQHVT